MPSSSRPDSPAKTASARVPPVVASQKMPTCMAAFRLPARDIEHMPEQAAERRAEDMQNPQRARSGSVRHDRPPGSIRTSVP